MADSITQNPEPQKPVVIFLCDGKLRDIYAKFKDHLSKREDLRTLQCATGPEAVQELKTSQAGIVLFGIKEKRDLLQILNALIETQTLIANKRVRFIGFNDIPEEKVDDLVRKKGASEIFPPSLNLRTLAFKFDRFLNLIKKAPQPIRSKELSTRNQASASREQNAKSLETQTKLRWMPPLTCEMDFWIVQKKRDLRNVRGMWLCTLIGPPPSQGKWTAPEGVESSTTQETQWRWVPRLETGQFSSDQGQWFFFGRKPEFDWKVLKWQMLGLKPRLCYQQADGAQNFRINCDQSDLMVTENSPIALAKLPSILSLMEGEKKFSKTKNSSSMGSISAENEFSGTPNEGMLLDFQDQRPGGAEPQEGDENEDEDLIGGWNPEKNQAPEEREVSDPTLDEMTEAIVIKSILKFDQQGPVKVDIEEVWDDSIIICSNTQAPIETTAVLYIDAMLGIRRLQLSLTGVLRGSEKRETLPESFELTFSFPETMRESTHQLLELFQERQKNISKFMKSAMGV